ncbi:MAG TPA: amidinotransferase [Candidatus Paceibacterota bacterium]
MHLNLNIQNETSKLKTVVLGRPCIETDISLENVYDAKSYYFLKNKNYPSKRNIKKQISSFEEILKKYGVQIYRPKLTKNCNLIFSRDVAFVIDDMIIYSKMVKDRQNEQIAYSHILGNISHNKIINFPSDASIEGGDVILYNDIIFLGIYKGNNFDQIKTARTNRYAYHYLKELCPHKHIIPIELKKNDFDPYKGTLHLDCAFMPISGNKAILYRDSLKNKKDYYTILEVFGEKNILYIDNNEAFSLHSNLLSISPQVIVSDISFMRVNSFLQNEWGLTVETTPYTEISKMGGLFRCSTLPLERIDDHV